MDPPIEPNVSDAPRAETGSAARHDSPPTPPAVTAEREGLCGDIDRLGARARTLSWVRLGSFAALVTLPFASLAPIARWLGLAAAAGAFAAAVAMHLRTLLRKEALERRRLLLDERRERREATRRLRAAPEIRAGAHPLRSGLRLHHEEPPAWELDGGVVDDLGLAAPAASPDGAAATSSVFGFLDWTSTAVGARRLLHLIGHPLRRTEDIRDRQEAVREMAERGAIRERILERLVSLRGLDLDRAATVLEEPLELAGRGATAIVADVLGTATPVCLVAAIVTGAPIAIAASVPLVALHFLSIGVHGRAVARDLPRVAGLLPLLDAWLDLGDALGPTDRWGREWARIASFLEASRMPFRRLRRWVALLGLHELGILSELLNLLTLWELRVLPRASTRVERERERLRSAVGLLGEAEAIVCLALPLAERPDFEMPEAVDAPRPFVRAEEIGHPLLAPAVSVRNPVALGGDGPNVVVVTGSNTAGKSTYLRSVGCNVVLASAGAPVCARGFRWTPLDIHSDVNIRDSLDDGKSYFLVEVERVHRAIRAADASPFTLVLFDELFRGTNSEERRASARAIVRHLRSTGALCVVATHDQAVAALAEVDREPGIENRHFQEQVHGSEMRFDYRLRDGPATTRNAIRLLEANGYPEEIVRQARGEAG